MAAEKASRRIGVGGETEISHVIEDEQVVLVLGERCHQGRHAEVIFSAAVDVLGRRVNAVRLEE